MKRYILVKIKNNNKNNNKNNMFGIKYHNVIHYV